MTNDKKLYENNNLNKTNRLPCRGCTEKCSNYERCNGKPWRLTNYITSSKRVKI